MCHYSAGTEAGSGTCCIKFGAARSGPGTEDAFFQLFDAAEKLSTTLELDRLAAGVNTVRHEAYRDMMARGLSHRHPGSCDAPAECRWLQPTRSIRHRRLAVTDDRCLPRHRQRTSSRQEIQFFVGTRGDWTSDTVHNYDGRRKHRFKHRTSNMMSTAEVLGIDSANEHLESARVSAIADKPFEMDSTFRRFALKTEHTVHPLTERGIHTVVSRIENEAHVGHGPKIFAKAHARIARYKSYVHFSHD